MARASAALGLALLGLAALATGAAAGPLQSLQQQQRVQTDVTALVDAPHPICDGFIGTRVISPLESINGIGGCSRYTKGYDITGTTNFVQVVTPTACDCALMCKQNSQTCASWVWKFVDNTMVGNMPVRKCTIYSNSNMPPGTVLGINGTSSDLGNVGGDTPLPPTGFVQGGGTVPHCQYPPFDINGNGVGWDAQCVSGNMWLLDNNLSPQTAADTRPTHMFAC